MNYIQHLNGFFDRIKHDRRLSTSHISLYIALFQYWNYNRFQGPFPIFRDKIMQLCKIGSKNTYHKCIKELHEAGYIRYYPPLSKFYPGKISITRLDTGNTIRQQPGLFDTAAVGPPSNKPDISTPSPPVDSDAENDTRASTVFGTHSIETDTDTSTDIDTASVSKLTVADTNFDTGTVPNLGHSIKQNSKTEKALSHENFNKPILGHDGNEAAGAQKNAPAKNSCLSIAWSAAASPPAAPLQNQASRLSPPYPDVWAYFLAKKYPDLEAEKFYNHYQAIGWKIQGVTPIHDWKALADKWMLNAPRFNRTTQAGPADSTLHIHTKTEKNYDEPL